MKENNQVELQINTEYEPLKTVIVHKPGKEIERLTSSNKTKFLFEDLPFLQQMQDEFKYFIDVLNKETDCKILYLDDLLLDLVKDVEIRKKLVNEIVVTERCAGLVEYLMKLDDEALVETFFKGITSEEWGSYMGRKRAHLSSEFVLDPIPNAYFTRDPAAIIGKSIVSCKMHYGVRERESILLSNIFKYHTYFKEKSTFCFGVNPDEERPFTVEGGDIIVINNHSVAIGWSQRTTPETIYKIAENLFSQYSDIERVYEVKIPSERAYMHLDTVCSIIGPGSIVVYPDVLSKDVVESSVYTSTIFGNKRIPFLIAEGKIFTECLEDELRMLSDKVNFKIIQTGGGDPETARREQWGDATNVLAIAPDKVITYDRNIKTNEALDSRGINVKRIQSSQLVLGRGGPRCMTLPLQRKS